MINPLNAEAKIFFSIWVFDKTILQNRILCNIHAFKLRKLKGYSISSREFAERYRQSFEDFKNNWENVNVNLGPLTLMEGWKEFNTENLESIIVTTANDFLAIDHLIDNTMKAFERTRLT